MSYDSLLWALGLATIVTNQAHLASPVVLAWGTRGYRAHMLARPEKFILLPALIIFGGLVFGLDAELASPGLVALYGVYLIWNSFHYGMQNFGLLALLRQRWLGFIAACVTMLAMSVMPLTGFGRVGGVVIAMSLVNWWHWTSDIGLSTMVSQRWFLPTALLAGASGFWFFGVQNGGMSMKQVPLLISLRCCLGFVHFLYSRWVWRFSDPMVRTTIGCNLGLT